MTPAHLSSIPVFKGRLFWVVLVLVAADLLSLGLGLRLAVEVRRGMIPWIGGVIPPDSFGRLILQSLAIIVLIYAFSGLYPGFGLTAVEETRKIFFALTLGFSVFALAIYFQQAGQAFSRMAFLLGWVFSCLLNIAVRFLARNRFSRLRWWGTPVLVVGPAELSQDVIRRLNSCRRLGLRPVLVCDPASPPGQTEVLGVPLVRSLEQVETLLRDHPLDFAVYTGQNLQDPSLGWLGEHFSSLLVVLEHSPLGSLWVKTMDLEGRLTLKTEYHLLERKALLAKRAFDLLAGLTGGLLLSPAMLLIALLIRLDSRGPAIFTQNRVGRGGKLFRCHKFRTMHAGAEDLLQSLLASDPAAAREFQLHHKLANDPRVTRFGRLLRKYSLDELPQFWNIIKGDLSLVGPRTFLPEELPDVGAHASIILRIRPGLTGWWQVMGRHTTTFAERLRLDEYYLSNWSPWIDAYILIKTVWIILSGKGV